MAYPQPGCDTISSGRPSFPGFTDRLSTCTDQTANGPPPSHSAAVRSECAAVPPDAHSFIHTFMCVGGALWWRPYVINKNTRNKRNETKHVPFRSMFPPLGSPVQGAI